MKVLQICNKPPFPAGDGGAIAMGNMMRCMVRNGYEVTVLNMVSYKHASSENDWPDGLRKKVKLHFAKVNLQVKPVNAFLNLFSSRSYHAERFFSSEVEEKIISILNSDTFDIIQMETIFPMVYYDVIRQHSKARIVLRLHNIEHEVWRSTAKAEKNLFRKWYLHLLSRRLKIFERNVLEKADGILTISSEDFKKLQLQNTAIKAIHIPFGLDLAKYPFPGQVNNPPCLFHLGAMDWIPNQVGMYWFLETAWKQLCKKYPQLKFFIAGRKMPEKFLKMKDTNLIVEGEVEEPVQFMQSKDIMVVPLLSGSGIRVKIIEGMALGKAIVTTSIGAAGIDCRDGENILIANTPDEFVKQISGCLNNTETIKKIGANARKLIEEKYSLEIVSNRLDEFFHHDLLK